MSWGTHIRGDIFLDKFILNNKKDSIYQLESMIDSIENSITMNKEELLILISGHKIWNSNKDNTGNQFDYIEDFRFKFDEIWKRIMDEKELMSKLKFTLNMLKDSKRLKIETY